MNTYTSVRCLVQRQTSVCSIFLIFVIAIFIYQRMYLCWSLCTLYLHALQVRVTVGDSGLYCCTCVTYFSSANELHCVLIVFKLYFFKPVAVLVQLADMCCYLDTHEVSLISFM